MKKRISIMFGIMVALCFMVSSMAIHAVTIVDTVENQKKAGELLKEINIIKGTSLGLEEEKTLTREQAIVILLRMLGLEEEAQNFPSYLQFSDVPATHWSAPYVNYAYTKGITNGIGNGKFGLGQVVNKKSMASYMLRALGHTADWSSEDIMGKARKFGITLDFTEGSEQITRGQAFIYMTNTLTQPKNNETKMLLETLSLSTFQDSLTKVEFQTAQQGTPPSGSNQQANLQEPPKQISENNPKVQPQKPDAPKEFVTVKLQPSLKPVAAKTYLYDELDVQFNTLVSFPQKNNFEFMVDGRRIEDAHYNISAGGNSIRFKFSNQNLHGKTIICKIMNLKASDGKSVISDAIITAQFKDFTPIKFVKAEVLDKKSFRGLMSVNVMPPDGHKKGTEGHEVYSDGKLMQENVDYQLGWGGKEFKVVFKKEDVYPKQNASLKVWGYMTAPYHKFMDESDEIVLDFSMFEKKDIPLPEVPEPQPPQIIVEPPKLGLVEIWKDVPVTQEPKVLPGTPAPAEPPKSYEDAKKGDAIAAKPIVVIDRTYFKNRIRLFTDDKVGTVEGLKLIDRNKKEVKVRFEAFEEQYSVYNPLEEREKEYQSYGFDIIDESSAKETDFAGYEVFVEKLYESTNQVYTGPFSFKINQIIN